MNNKKITQQEPQKVFSKTKPDCKECKKCGAIAKPKKNLIGKWLSFDLCEKCSDKKKQEEEKHYLKKLRKNRRQSKIERYFEQSNLGKRFKQRTFENFKVDNDNRNAYRKSREFALHFEDRLENGRGIIFFGDNGTGKTHLAAAILQDAIQQEHTGVFVSVPDLIAKIRKSWNSEDNESDLIDTLIKADVVVMDDLGAENTKAWIVERLFVIINARYERMLPVIFTSNCNFQELKQKVGGRIESRIYEMCEGISLTGEDFRKNWLKR
jgi:DNA replication protein DnaC